MPFAIPILIGLISGAVGIVMGRASNSPPPAAAAAPNTSVTPPPPLTGSGQANDAANDAAEKLRQAHSTLRDVDKRLEDLEKATAESNAAVKKELDTVKSDLDAKAAELGERLKTPEGLKEFRDFYIQRLEKAKSTLEAADADANNKARDARGIIEDYMKLAGNDDGGSSERGGGSHGGGNGGSGGGEGGSGGEGGGGPEGTPPPGTTQPASAVPGQPAAPTGGLPFGMPGGGMPMGGGMPGMGGGGMPGGGGPGFSDPVAGLGSGLTQPAGLTDAEAKHEPGAAEPKLDDKKDGQTSPASTEDGTTDDKKDGDDKKGHVTPAGNATPAGVSVALPDGSKTDAPSTAAAAAMRSAIDGTPVETAWQQAGVTLPPAGTPILDPVPPGDLKGGDVGYFKDHLVMALGNNKFLVNGQVQPESSLSSGPDFLGWMRPGTSTGGGGEQPPASTPVTPPATPPATGQA